MEAGGEQCVHCSEVVPSSEVEMYGQYRGRGEQFVHCSEVVPSSEVEMNYYRHWATFVDCREVVHSSECPLSEVPLCILVGSR